MKFVLFVLSLVLATAIATEFIIPEEESQAVFAHYTKKFGKTYSVDEIFARFNTFRVNYEKIVKHNAANKHSYTLGLTSLTDLTTEEYKTRLGFKLSEKTKSMHVKLTEGKLTTGSLDWRTKGVVNAIKDQGQCGSCWAFSTVASSETAIAIAKGKLHSLSEQHLVDCTSDYGCSGCNGCLMANAFNYMLAEGGLCTETAYPYTGEDGTCASSTCGDKYNIKSYHNITCGLSDYCDKIIKMNETNMLEHVNKGVVSIAIEADQDIFQSYTSGVIDSSSCGTSLDHGVAIIGYGTESGTPYWLVRNSWGTSWGLDGYVKIARGKNICGIAEYSEIPYA
jgi:C1A family cysteine protease